MKPNEPVSYHVATCIISISLPVAYLGGKAGILEKEGAKKTNWHVSYQSQGGASAPLRPPPPPPLNTSLSLPTKKAISFVFDYTTYTS